MTGYLSLFQSLQENVEVCPRKLVMVAFSNIFINSVSVVFSHYVIVKYKSKCWHRNDENSCGGTEDLAGRVAQVRDEVAWDARQLDRSGW